PDLHHLQVDPAVAALDDLTRHHVAVDADLALALGAAPLGHDSSRRLKGRAFYGLRTTRHAAARRGAAPPGARSYPEPARGAPPPEGSLGLRHPRRRRGPDGASARAGRPRSGAGAPAEPPGRGGGAPARRGPRARGAV